jgi:predicted TIM-barrel fold metal-dependent hydrolase
MTRDLLLRDFAPRSRLRVPETVVERPRYPVVDAHNHLGSAFAGDWPMRPVEELVAVMDEAGVETLVDMDGGVGPHLRAELDRYVGRYPGRFAVFAGLDYDAWATDERFGETEASRLRGAVSEGAAGLKVWKVLGLRARDSRGRLVAVDDPRLDPLWAAAGELRVPVTIHVADPIAFFDPIDRFNERREELLEHPDWHVHPIRPAGRPDAPGLPSFDELMAQLDALLGSHPGTTFIGAHVGCAAEDLAWVAGRLHAHANFHVDIAARIGELGRQPYSARDFFLRYADRILFATDDPPAVGAYRLHYRFLETKDECFAYDLGDVPSQGRWRVHGLGLPDDVLRRVYNANARRLIRAV